MPIHCDVFIRWLARPEQLRTLGKVLWSWKIGAAGDNGIYQFLDDQPLADLIAGRLPLIQQSLSHDPRGYRFRIRDTISHDRSAAISRLRREMPVDGIDDILVDGASWNLDHK